MEVNVFLLAAGLSTLASDYLNSSHDLAAFLYLARSHPLTPFSNRGLPNARPDLAGRFVGDKV
jgi:hypothetical protein